MLIISVKAPIQSRYMLDYETGVNRLLPSTEQDIQQMFSALVYHKEQIPQNRNVLKGFLQLQNGKTVFLEER